MKAEILYSLGECGNIIGNNFYYSSSFANGLFCIDIISWKCSFLDSFVDEELCKANLHKSCITASDKIIFVPYAGRHIHIFDTKKREQMSVSIEDLVDESWNGMIDYVMLDNSFFFFSESVGCYLRFELDKMQLDVVESFQKWCEKIGIDSKNKVFLRAAQNKHFVYFAVKGTNRLLKWDIINETGTEYRLNIDGLFGIEKNKDTMLISRAKSSEICIWDPDSDSMSGCINCKDSEEIRTHRPYNRLFTFDGKMIGVFSFKPCVLVVDNKQIKYSDYSTIVEDDEIRIGYGYGVYENSLLLFTNSFLKVLELNLKDYTFIIHNIEINISDSYESWLHKVRNTSMKEGIINNLLVNEKVDGDLNYFIRNI